MARTDEKRVSNARLNLIAALPKGHPVQKEVDDVLAQMWKELRDFDVAMEAANIDQEKAEATIRTTEGLMDALEDWRRGVRDWDEVERALKAAGLARDDQADKA